MYLSLRDIVKIFPARGGGREVTAVDHVSLDIEQGELVTLLGPSGCGKTTTLRMIAGFEFPTSGEILLDGARSTCCRRTSARCRWSFQSYAIFPHLNVLENVSYGLNVKHVPKAEIKQRVAEGAGPGAADRAGRARPNQLSGGQQQRVALARALVMHPKVLLMDEPLSNLDAKLREQMRTEIRRIQKRWASPASTSPTIRSKR
jgi:iron(III) transport system ATP-binding protein